MKGILFDLDGTLIDTAADMLYALKLLAAENNISIEPDYLTGKELITYGSKALINSVFKEINSKDFIKLQNRYLEIYQQNLMIDTCVFPKLDIIIKLLQDKNISWGIVTNKPFYLSKPIVQSIPILSNCEILVGGDTTNHSKPHPEPINYALNHMGLTACNSWYIGDAQSDINAANAAGMKSAVALWGYLKASDNPNNWLADKLLKCPSEILNLLN